MSTPKYLLTLTDSESGMTLRQEKPGYIQVGINGGEVEFSMPVAFLKSYVKASGGTLNFPEMRGGTPPQAGSSGDKVARLGSCPAERKILYIKTVRNAAAKVGHPGNPPGLKETKDLVESAMTGAAPIAFRGSASQVSEFLRMLEQEGFYAYEEDFEELNT